MRVVVNPKAFRNANLPESQSFFALKDPNLVISAVKKAEDDQSVIVRIFEAMGKESESVLKTSQPFRSAMQTNLIEEPMEEVELRATGVVLDMGHHQIETLKLK
jgi:alpha-mannosidase